MSILLRIFLLISLILIMGSCKSTPKAVLEPSPTLVVDDKPLMLPVKAADLVIKDMFFVRVEEAGDIELPSVRYDLHVIIKNVGKEEAKNFAVEVNSDEKVTEFDRIFLDPASGSHAAAEYIKSLDPGAEKEVVWKEVARDPPGFGANFFIAIVDRPGGSKQFGAVVEGPTIAAEKNNTMGIPAPHK